MAYKHSGYYEDAILHFKSAISLKPLSAADAHNELGNIYYAKNNFHLALEQFKEALKLKPKNYVTYTNIGFIYMQKGDLDNAIKNFKLALSINPDLIRAHTSLGLALYYKGMYDEAKREYNRALNLMPAQNKISDPSFLQLQELLLPLQNAGAK